MSQSHNLTYWSTIGDPQLAWKNGEPYSQQFGDSYASHGAAAAETNHVFLQGNQLPQRFAGAHNFTVAETGFGTGLNFCMAAQLWQSSNPGAGTLHFVTIERFPLDVAQARQAAGTWPQELQPVAQKLLAQWPEYTPGWHTITLPEFRTRLLIYHGDIQAIEDWEIQADCWFLDGFAPAKNPAIWQDSVLQSIAANTRPGGTLATFTAAGAVRRGLEQAGFDVQRAPGFAGKRHMTTAVLPTAKPKGMPWFALPPPATETGTPVAIIGAGIAGCATASRLAAAGFQVDLIDRASGPGHQASGNPAGILMPHISADPSPMSAWNNQAYLVARRCYQNFGWEAEGLWYQPPAHTPAGLLQRWLAWAGLGEAHGRIQPNKMALADQPGLYAQAAGSIQPTRMLANLLAQNSDRIHCHWHSQVLALQRGKTGWQLHTDATTEPAAEYAHVVLCTGYDPQLLHPLLQTQVEPARGQVTLGSTAAPHNLSQVFCERGYMIPTDTRGFVTGASYQRGNANLEAIAADNAENMARLQQAYRFPAGEVQGQRVSIRGTTRDHLPLVGPAPNFAACTAQYQDLHRGKAPATYADATCLQGVWLNLAHGSRGFSSAVYAADLLADWIGGNPAPVQRTVREAVHPLRFAIRHWKRG